MHRLASVIFLLWSVLFCQHTTTAQPRDNLGLCIYPSISAVSTSAAMQPDGAYFKLLPKATLQAGLCYSYFLSDHFYVHTGITVGWRNFCIRQVRFDDSVLAGNNSITLIPIIATLNPYMEVGYYAKGFSFGLGPSLTFARYRNAANTINRITTAPQGVKDDYFFLTFAENDYTLLGACAALSYTWKNQNGRWFSIGAKADVPFINSPRMQLESHIVGHIYNTDFQVRQNLFSVSLVRYFGKEPSANVPVPVDE